MQGMHHQVPQPAQGAAQERQKRKRARTPTCHRASIQNGADHAHTRCSWPSHVEWVDTVAAPDANANKGLLSADEHAFTILTTRLAQPVVAASQTSMCCWSLPTAPSAPGMHTLWKLTGKSCKRIKLATASAPRMSQHCCWQSTKGACHLVMRA